MARQRETIYGMSQPSLHRLAEHCTVVVSSDFTRSRNSSLTFPLLLLLLPPETDGACFTDLAFACPVAAAGN